MNIELKNRILSMCDLCDSIEEVMRSNGDQVTTSIPYRDIFLTDAFKFVFFLIGKNKDELTGKENTFLKEYLNMPVPQEDFEGLVEHYGAYGIEFIKEVPWILKLFVDADNLVYERTGGHESVASAELAELFRMIGLEFLKYGEPLGPALFFAVPYAANMFEYIDSHVSGVSVNVHNDFLDNSDANEGEDVEDDEDFEDTVIYEEEDVRIEFCGLEFADDAIKLRFWINNDGEEKVHVFIENVSVNWEIQEYIDTLAVVEGNEYGFCDYIIKNVPNIQLLDISRIGFFVKTDTTPEDFDDIKFVYINCSPRQETFDVEIDTFYGSDDEECMEDIPQDSSVETETLDTLISQLNALVGLDSVKEEVTSLINLLQIRKLREERGLKQAPLSMHLVFSGNPGTGKTTVARLLAKIYHQLGVVSKGHLVEVDRSGLVAGYVGHTALKVQSVLQDALGGILFVDEAYALTTNKGENDFGTEAVETLLKGMEDNRDDLVVIVAGYPDLMNEFLNSNPGLRSRFNKFIYFSDYTSAELTAIFKKMCEEAGYSPDHECLTYVEQFFERRYQTRNENFANARDVRNFFEKAVMNQANRLTATSLRVTDELLSALVLEDVIGINI